jgi:hypothetical protein
MGSGPEQFVMFKQFIYLQNPRPDPPGRDPDPDDDEAPETPTDEPPPLPVQDPPDAPGRREPYVAKPTLTLQP